MPPAKAGRFAVHRASSLRGSRALGPRLGVGDGDEARALHVSARRGAHAAAAYFFCSSLLSSPRARPASALMRGARCACARCSQGGQLRGAPRCVAGVPGACETARLSARCDGHRAPARRPSMCGRADGGRRGLAGAAPADAQQGLQVYVSQKAAESRPAEVSCVRAFARVLERTRARARRGRRVLARELVAT